MHFSHVSKHTRFDAMVNKTTHNVAPGQKLVFAEGKKSAPPVPKFGQAVPQFAKAPPQTFGNMYKQSPAPDGPGMFSQFAKAPPPSKQQPVKT